MTWFISFGMELKLTIPMKSKSFWINRNYSKKKFNFFSKKIVLCFEKHCNDCKRGNFWTLFSILTLSHQHKKPHCHESSSRFFVFKAHHLSSRKFFSPLSIVGGVGDEDKNLANAAVSLFSFECCPTSKWKKGEEKFICKSFSEGSGEGQSAL